MKKTPTILYIDDDLFSLFLLKEQLKELNINVITECNGMVGYDTYLETKDEIDLIILDINIPHIDGYDLLLKIRNVDSKIPILMVTVNSSMESKDFILETGANDYLTKPLSKQQILSTLSKYLT